MQSNIKTIGIFSKCGMPGGSENRVVQLANSFSKLLSTYIFAEKELSSKLKPIVRPEVIIREHTVNTKQYIYELQGVDCLLVVNSDSYSFCKTSYWDGTQKIHHESKIDLSNIPHLVFLFNYVMGPAQWLVELHKINPRIKLMATCEWFINNLKKEKKFEKLRQLKLPTMSINSPVSANYRKPKTPTDKIRINRHSMSFAYKHDEDNLKVIKAICEKYKDKILFKWMGVPSMVRNVEDDSKDASKIEYSKVLSQYPQMEIIKEYTMPVPDFLAETDILFFYISRFRKEPWPRTIAEGMMAGCCCVTNNSYGMAEQIKSGETGFLFDNADQAIEQLSSLIENPEMIKTIGNKAMEYAELNFKDDVITEKMLNFIQNGI